MNMEELLEQIDEALDDGTKLFGRKTVVDVEKIRALIDELRLNMPSEIKQARGIVADRADIITNAKKEAEYIRIYPIAVLYFFAVSKNTAGKIQKIGVRSCSFSPPI